MTDGRSRAPLSGPVLLAAVMLCASAVTARAETSVSMELVLAVDTSLSVDDAEYELQMRGLEAAFRSEEVVDLIGRHEGGVAIAILQWSGVADTEGMSWHLLTGPASVKAYADAIAALERWPYGYLTGVGEAIMTAIEQIEGNAYRGRELKIDVSGDGRSNTGPEAAAARDEAIARGMTVNGLAILNAEAGLGEYFATDVIGGRGAFLIEAADYRDYAEAIRRKLLRELELNVSQAPPATRLADYPEGR